MIIWKFKWAASSWTYLFSSSIHLNMTINNLPLNRKSIIDLEQEMLKYTTNFYDLQLLISVIWTVFVSKQRILAFGTYLLTTGCFRPQVKLIIGFDSTKWIYSLHLNQFWLWNDKNKINRSQWSFQFLSLGWDNDNDCFLSIYCFYQILILFQNWWYL